MPRTLVVADDLTGAIDTAHAFAARGYRTRVQVDPGRAPPDSTVLALNTDSRYADSETTGIAEPAELRVARIESTMEPDELLVSEPVARKLDGRADVEVGELRPLAFEDGASSPID